MFLENAKRGHSLWFSLRARIGVYYSFLKIFHNLVAAPSLSRAKPSNIALLRFLNTLSYAHNFLDFYLSVVFAFFDESLWKKLHKILVSSQKNEHF